MSQPEPQPQPLSYAPEPAARPTSVTVMAIIGIIFGALGFLCSPLSLIPFFIELPPPNPMDAIKNDSLLFGWMVAATVMNWLLAIFLLAGSIGALGLREWGRQMLIGWSVGAMLISIVQFAFTLVYVNPRMKELSQSQPGAAAFAGGSIGAIVGIVFGIGIPAVMLFFMTRPHVKEAFARGLRRII